MNMITRIIINTTRQNKRITNKISTIPVENKLLLSPIINIDEIVQTRTISVEKNSSYITTLLNNSTNNILYPDKQK